MLLNLRSIFWRTNLRDKSKIFSSEYRKLIFFKLRIFSRVYIVFSHRYLNYRSFLFRLQRFSLAEARVNQMRFVWREYRARGVSRKSKRSRRLATLSPMGVTHNLLEKATTSLCTVLVRGFYGGRRIVGFSSGLYFFFPCRSIFTTTANCVRSITSFPRYFFATLRHRVVHRCINAPAKWFAHIPNASS